MAKLSPQAVKRAKTALREAGSQRDAVDTFNELAVEQAGHRLGKKNTCKIFFPLAQNFSYFSYYFKNMSFYTFESM